MKEEEGVIGEESIILAYLFSFYIFLENGKKILKMLEPSQVLELKHHF
jgi:hypothetical protein